MAFDSNGIYHLEDIAFVNTSQFTEAATHFKKHGCYTKAPPRSRDFKEYWDIEEDRLRNGMKAPGKLIGDKIQEVHITGEHYGFLNYARILRTKDQDIQELKRHITGGGPLTKHSRKVGKKDMDFPSFLDGQFHWFKFKEEAAKLGLHVVMAKARRKGFSYMEGWDCAHTVNLNPFVTVAVGAWDNKYILFGNQMLPMAKRYLDFLELHTDFNRGFLKESVDHIRLGYKLPDTGNIEYGYRSEILGISFMNNPDASAGKDVRKWKLEEMGKFPNVKQVLTILLPTLRDGAITTGQLVMFGTGGTDEANWADFEDIFYNPGKYQCATVNNIWDEGSSGTSCGFFYPQYTGDLLYVDNHGNSLKNESIANNDLERAEVRKTKTPSEYVKFISQDARTPREAFASSGDSIFPLAEIDDQLKRVEHNPDFSMMGRYGRVVRTKDGLVFKTNDELLHDGIKVHDPILNYPVKDGQDVDGCVTFWMNPYRDPKTGRIPDNLYRLWNDPYAHDKDKKNITMKHSLGATYIYERPNNITPGKGGYFIGCYIGRPPRVDDYNEQLLAITEFVNGICMFENDRGDVKRYFAEHKKLHLLADEPDLEWNVALQGKTGRGKGFHVDGNRKGDAAVYLRDWLLQKRGVDQFGNDKLNLHYIYDAGLLRELLKWNLSGNFDRVSALLVGMFDMYEMKDKAIKMPSAKGKGSFFLKSFYGN